MLTTDTLQLLRSLAEDDPPALEPEPVGRAGEVRYPAAEPFVDGDVAERLAALAERGVLRATFHERVLACPSCESLALVYRHACADCGSGHVDRRVLFEHTPCGCIRGRDAFGSDEAGETDEAGEAGRCPECAGAVAVGGAVAAEPAGTAEVDGLVRMGEMYRCMECGDRSGAPADRLRCMDCDAVLTLRDPAGVVLYQYAFNEAAAGWLAWQFAAREHVVDLLETRGYRTRTDVAVGDGDRRVHLHATDPVFDLEVVAAIRDEPSLADVDAIRTTSEDAEATPLLVAMAGHVSGAVASAADRHGVPILPVGGDATEGSLDGSTSGAPVDDEEAESAPTGTVGDD